MENQTRITAELAGICENAGVRHVFICPGSRSAPLTLGFSKGHFQFHVLVDERSAAYAALGLSLATSGPVALVCTSGTAALNFYPAIAEAFFRKVPLLVFTADRPEEWIGQQDGQAIFQQEVYGRHVKKSFSLNGDIFHAEYLRYGMRSVYEGISLATEPGNEGPVHFNLSFREPLYNELLRIPHAAFEASPLKYIPEESLLLKLRKKLAEKKKIMVLAGQGHASEEEIKIIHNFCERTGAVLAGEPLSNTRADGNFGFLPEDLVPDLLISFGGPVVHKKFRQLIRASAVTEHWHIDPAAEFIDSYGKLNRKIRMKIADLIPLLDIKNIQSSDYRIRYNSFSQSISERSKKFELNHFPEADLQFYRKFLPQLPKNSVLHLANSTPVRYGNLCWDILPAQTRVESNRGTSGIDGCTSTAAGFAMADSRPNFLITGELAFHYDLNGLWNKEFPQNLKMIVINNQGGNIFRLIEGPSGIPERAQFFEVSSVTEIENIAKHFGIPFYSILPSENIPQDFFTTEKAAILEVKTDPGQSAEAFKAFHKHLYS